MDAVVFLEQVKKLDKMIENKLTDVALLKRKAEGLSGGSDDVVVYKNGKKELHRMDKVKTSKDNQPMATIIAKFLDLEAEIDADIDKLIDKRKKVIKVIEMLKAREYDLMHKVYIQYMTLEEAAYEMGKSYSWATTTHSSAKRNVQKILDDLKY